MRMRSVVFLALLLPTAVRAESERVSSFWERTGESALIVVARVERVRPRNSERRAIAVLHITSTLKGTSSPTLEVSFGPSGGFPTPARYREGDTVLALLEPGLSGFVTVGNERGAQSGTPEQLAVLTRLTRHAIDAQSKNTREARRAWVIELFTEPLTRPAAIRELEHSPLSDDEYAQLKAAVLAKPDCLTLGLSLRLFGSRRDDAITSLAKNALETLVAKAPNIVGTLALLDRVEVLLGASEEEITGRWLSLNEEPEARARWAAMKKRYKLKPRALNCGPTH